MDSSLGRLAEMLVNALKLPSTFPALCWLGLNWLVFENYLENTSLMAWWLEMGVSAQIVVLTLLALFIGYTLDNFIFVFLDVFANDDICQDLDIHSPLFELTETMCRGRELTWDKYGIDASWLRPHLMAILSKDGYTTLIEREKASLDYSLNLSLLSLIFVFECVVAHMLGWRGQAFIPVMILCLAYLFYRLAISCARKWYDWINAAYDLYRYQLAKELSLGPFSDIEDEMDVWQTFTYCTRNGVSYADFNYKDPSAVEVTANSETKHEE